MTSATFEQYATSAGRGLPIDRIVEVSMEISPAMFV
jgi:hypothetical protein